ncbi:unnamed protein product (macronuclear) [Paramecium tetraurelia]|uniref:Uncharacterized protein n=1 Tax=Paramecium tetraurelia TaxID=5888 RepID=A0DFS3_PARTE|nr:uncharacterized protein GSPATT00016703001 [Paramecium tetraurelia]CAK81890.1 unnamed protein product [Paramecium tetraurelia]|eukprot:XP_001449287.1 hypothetical protein (macronuclear) [Paramecium tetraurelia strain d4-2]
MNDWESNYSQSLASTFGPWYPSTTKNKMMKAQHTQTLSLEPLGQKFNRTIQSKTSVPKRRAISVQRRLPTFPTMDTTTKVQKQRTLPEPVFLNLTQEALFVRSNKNVQGILKKLQYYRFNERHLIS